MRLAIITPTAHTKEFSSNEDNYYMALAQRVLNDKEYASFFRNASRRGGYVILDNGACELKESIRADALIQAIDSIMPQVVVLPDKLGDSFTTIKLSTQFLTKIGNRYTNKVSFMGVVQGKTQKEWMHVFNFFLRHPNIDIIGISNSDAMFKTQGKMFSRVATLKYLKEKNISFENKKIHLLGLPDSGHLELSQMQEFSFVEGVDTNAPVVHGANGIIFEKGKPYIKIREYLDPSYVLTTEQKENVKKNIEILSFAAKGIL